MITLAAQHGANPPSSGWFALLWSFIAIPAGIALASRAGSGWFHQRLVDRSRGNHFPPTIPAPVWTLRLGGTVLAAAGVVALPSGIWLIVR
ncbi:hypothetical protein [Streptomyces sp. H39-S7]|uniref:hypothetical protein n=1 Tax=Streptomyces sp. H39-S7 TaxID=3004357 RepID=UPI0022B06583|nr:hypothetical protein [Streptomyces sp. H39-S7]MCZ4121086.1 hypothetical protein [Streptomyces sp. H39-S7]